MRKVAQTQDFWPLQVCYQYHPGRVGLIWNECAVAGEMAYPCFAEEFRNSRLCCLIVYQNVTSRATLLQPCLHALYFFECLREGRHHTAAAGYGDKQSIHCRVCRAVARRHTRKGNRNSETIDEFPVPNTNRREGKAMQRIIRNDRQRSRARRQAGKQSWQLQRVGERRLDTLF